MRLPQCRGEAGGKQWRRILASTGLAVCRASAQQSVTPCCDVVFRCHDMTSRLLMCPLRCSSLRHPRTPLNRRTRRSQNATRCVCVLVCRCCLPFLPWLDLLQEETATAISACVVFHSLLLGLLCLFVCPSFFSARGTIECCCYVSVLTVMRRFQVLCMRLADNKSVHRHSAPNFRMYMIDAGKKDKVAAMHIQRLG